MSRPRISPPWTPPPAGRRSATRPCGSSVTTTAPRPQLEALRISDDPRGRAPVGMDIALLVYSGISVKMMVDRTFGADMVTMFTVDYEVGGAAQAHDHPFEEAYVFLAGEVECELDGERFTLQPGRHRLLRRRVGARVLERGHRARPLDRDPGAPAARPTRLSLGPELGALRPTTHAGSEGTQWLTQPRSSSSAAHGRSARRSRATTPIAGESVVLTGQDPATSRPRVADVGGRRPGATFDLSEPTSIAAALAGVGPVRRLVLAAIDRDQNTVADYDIVKAIRLVTLKLVGYTEVVHTLRPRLTDDASIVLFGGMAKERPYPGSTTVTTVNGGVVGLTRTLVEELKPLRVNSHPPGRRRRQPVLVREAGRRREVHERDADRPPGHDGRDRRRGGLPAREHRRERRRPHRGRGLALSVSLHPRRGPRRRP